MKICNGSKRASGPPSATRGAMRPEGASVLLEVLVGGAVLAFAVVSIYTAFSFGFTTIRVSQENVRANQILVEKLEILRVYDWSQITNNGYIPANFTAVFSPAGQGASGVTYTGTMAIAAAPLTDSYSNTLRQATVTLQWLSGGVPRSRALSTFVSQYGIQTYKR